MSPRALPRSAPSNGPTPSESPPAAALTSSGGAASILVAAAPVCPPCGGATAASAPATLAFVSAEGTIGPLPPRDDSMPAPDFSEHLSALPPRPGCYLFYNRRGELLYIGKAVSLRNRVRSYFHKDRDRAPKIRRLVRQISRIEWREVPTELHALALECRLIKQHQPRFNALLKGDRRLPRLRITLEEPFPRAYIDWEPPVEGGCYFGPFTRADAAEGLLDVLHRVFQLRSCDLAFTGREGLRPCLYYHLGQCLAPCSRKQCGPDEYADAVRSAIEFLEGRQESLAERLGAEMEAAAEALRFERAARLRDMRDAVLRWLERQSFVAAWDEPSGIMHCFMVRHAQLSGYYPLRREEVAGVGESWRPALEGILLETYGALPGPATHFGSSAIEELGIVESWLARKRARRAFVVPPRTSDDRAALDRMLRLFEEWISPSDT